MKDRNLIWAWAIGIAIFASVAGVWAWLLPQNLGGAAGKDLSLSSIFSSMDEAKKDLVPALAEVSAQLDENMAELGVALESEKSRSEAVDKLKQDLTEEAVRQKIKAAMEADARPADNR
jgi:hypothetical protein